MILSISIIHGNYIYVNVTSLLQCGDVSTRRVTMLGESLGVRGGKWVLHPLQICIMLIKV